MAVKVHERKEPTGDGHKGNMLDLARKMAMHYTSPSPQATIYEPAYFPVTLDVGLAGGLILGALVGALFGGLVHGGAILIRGTEGLFSLTPITFYTFWGIAGAALGMLVGGTLALLATPGPILQERAGEEAVVVEEDLHVVMVDTDE